MLTLMTMTGARPEAFRLCQHFMARQDYVGRVRWLVVDDGQEATPVGFAREGWSVEVIRPEPFWEPGQNTQARNILAGLDRVAPDDRLLVIEDDDWYAPDWLSKVAQELEHAELVGETHARYYNLQQRVARQLTNAQHASLCASAMRGAALRLFRQVAQERPVFIDLDLWKRAPSKKLFTGHRVVGMKGLPGRGGIGMGHDRLAGTKDPAGAALAQWVGEDARLYRALVSR